MALDFTSRRCLCLQSASKGRFPLFKTKGMACFPESETKKLTEPSILTDFLTSLRRLCMLIMFPILGVLQTCTYSWRTQPDTYNHTELHNYLAIDRPENAFHGTNKVSSGTTHGGIHIESEWLDRFSGKFCVYLAGCWVIYSTRYLLTHSKKDMREEKCTLK